MKRQKIVAIGVAAVVWGSYVAESKYEKCEKYYRMKAPHTHNELPISEQLADSAQVANSTLPAQAFLDLGSLVEFLPTKPPQ